VELLLTLPAEVPEVNCNVPAIAGTEVPNVHALAHCKANTAYFDPETEKVESHPENIWVDHVTE
jgi:hypothetical protein